MRVRLPREFTRREKTIIDEEINKLILQRDMDYAADMDAMILYVLAKEYGWRRKRLRRFWNKFRKAHQELRDYSTLAVRTPDNKKNRIMAEKSAETHTDKNR